MSQENELNQMLLEVLDEIREMDTIRQKVDKILVDALFELHEKENKVRAVPEPILEISRPVDVWCIGETDCPFVRDLCCSLQRGQAFYSIEEQFASCPLKRPFEDGDKRDWTIDECKFVLEKAKVDLGKSIPITVIERIRDYLDELDTLKYDSIWDQEFDPYVDFER